MQLDIYVYFVKIKNAICYFLGHKADKTVLAYRIKSHDTLYDVKVYEVSKCSHCNKIYEKLIDWYHNYDWYVEFAIRQKEKEKDRRPSSRKTLMVFFI